MEDIHEFTVPTGFTEAKWVRAIDLLPGTPAIVRSATISLKGNPERLLAHWLPGQDAPASTSGAAYHLPAGAELIARVRYKKTWSYEGKAMNDRSTIGLYFADAANAKELTSVPLPAQDVPAAGQTFSFSGAVDDDVQLVALNANEAPDDVLLQVEAVRPDGSRTPLVRFMSRSDWARRYWFAKPLALPRGTKIEVKGTVEDPDLTSAAFGGAPTTPKATKPAVKLALDVVRGGAASAAP
jgi:hypothetical protein